MTKNPQPIDDNTAAGLTLETVASVKRPDCSFYSDCLSTAIEGNWANFGCSSCKAYQIIDHDQRVSDALALRVMLEASAQVLKYGNANRIRGVKPGAEGKARVRLPILVERIEGGDDAGVGLKFY